MNLIWRTILHFLFASRAPISSPFEVVTSAFRVLPTDLDVNGHMNNGRYLSISDLGRFDMLSRGGLWRELMRRGWYPVIASSTISYRKSLNPWHSSAAAHGAGMGVELGIGRRSAFDEVAGTERVGLSFRFGGQRS